MNMCNKSAILLETHLKEISDVQIQELKSICNNQIHDVKVVTSISNSNFKSIELYVDEIPEDIESINNITNLIKNIIPLQEILNYKGVIYTGSRINIFNIL